MRRIVLALIAVVPFAMHASDARANAPEDIFGMGSRTTAMGGAAVAMSNDPFAAYHNPAGLTRCADHQLVNEMRYTAYSLSSTRVGADAPAEATRAIENPLRANIGACLRLPQNFAVGFSLGVGLQNPATIHLDTASAQPNFALYGNQLEYLSINLAAAWRPVRQVAIGAGATVLVHTTLTLASYVPVGQLDANSNFTDLNFNIGVRVKPTAAPYIGVLVEPHRRLRVGATFRGEIAHHMDLPLSIVAVFLDWTVPIPMLMRADAWYSPMSLSLGAAGEITPNVTVSAEASWYGYHSLRKSAYPYMTVSEIPGSQGSILGLVGIPTPDAPGYRNVWALRAGIEGRILDGRLALRGGYGLRTSALPDPGTRNTTLLDGMMHSFTGGAGYAFGRRWDEIDARHPAGSEAEARERRHQRRVAARVAARRGHQVIPDGEPALEEDEEEEDEDDEERTEFSLRIDVYGRLSVMPTQTSAAKDIRYGGSIFDMGATFTLGFR